MKVYDVKSLQEIVYICKERNYKVVKITLVDTAEELVVDTNSSNLYFVSDLEKIIKEG